MDQRQTTSYQPLTPTLTWPERIADMLVTGAIIFWFSFLGVVPQKGRPQDLPGRPQHSHAGNDNELAEAPRLAAE